MAELVNRKNSKFKQWIPFSQTSMHIHYCLKINVINFVFGCNVAACNVNSYSNDTLGYNTKHFNDVIASIVWADCERI